MEALFSHWHCKGIARWSSVNTKHKAVRGDAMNSERECYGKMFPSVIEVAHDTSTAGRVFGYEVYYSGQVAHSRVITVNQDAWRQCLKCSYLDGCYRMSVGTMLMEFAVKSAPDSQYR